MIGACFLGETSGVGDDLRERLLVQREKLGQSGDTPGDETGVAHFGRRGGVVRGWRLSRRMLMVDVVEESG